MIIEAHTRLETQHQEKLRRKAQAEVVTRQRHEFLENVVLNFRELRRATGNQNTTERCQAEDLGQHLIEQTQRNDGICHAMMETPLSP